MRKHHVSLLLVLLACTRANGERPNTLVVRGAENCEGCRLVIDTVAQLGGEADTSVVRPNIAGRDCLVARTSRGDFVFGGLLPGGVLNVYDSAGAFIRTIGRSGAGPGELKSWVRLAVGPGDSLLVIDDANARIQLFANDGAFVRGLQTRGRYGSFALLSSGQLVLFSTPTRRTDKLFHVFDRQGAEVGAFGVPTQPDSSLDLENSLITAAPGGRFWTASIWSYELKRWAAPDSLNLTVQREVSWFPQFSGYPTGVYQSAPPPPLLLHAREDDGGRLWTFAAIPDPAWTPGMKVKPSPEWFERTFDTMIEVIDISSGKLLASYRHPSRLAAVCGSELMYSAVETAEGDLRVQIVRPRLVRLM